MGIQMAALMPHPPIIIPEIGGSRLKDVKQTVSGVKELAGEIKDKNPDLLITISPHGPVFRDGISVLKEERITGNFGDFGNREINFKENSNLRFIEKLQKKAEENNIDIFTNTNRLDHGVMVPLYYLKKAGLDADLVSLTMGLLDYATLYEFGAIINQIVEETGHKAVVIASGDLSHRLSAGAPAGYNPRGEEFDKKIIKYLENKQFQKILNIDPLLIKKAGECGLRPIIIMLGSIRHLEVKVDVKSYEGPFGVGYGVVAIYREGA